MNGDVCGDGGGGGGEVGTLNSPGGLVNLAGIFHNVVDNYIT